MKKSKIIVPALAMIGLSAVASITGSVAWFTAQRTGSITTDKFAVVKTDGVLGITSEGRIGTNAAANVISPKTNCTLTDASFNPSTRALYTDADGGQGHLFTELDDGSGYHNADASADAYKVSSTVYYAFTWDVTVTYEWGADTRNLNVFFDYEDSWMKAYDGSDNEETGANIETAKGFRIAIINKTASPTKTIVYGALEDATAQFKGCYGEENNNFAVYGNTGLTSNSFAYFGGSRYGFGNVDASDDTATTAKGSYSKANDGTDNQTQREDYLISLTYANKVENQTTHKYETSATFTCVAWYEGNDANVINAKELQKVESEIVFYSTVKTEA